MPGRRPAIVTGFPDVQEVLQRPDVFTVTYAPATDPSVGPSCLAATAPKSTAATRHHGGNHGPPRPAKGAAAVMRLADEAVTPQMDKRSIEIVNTVSRVVPMAGG